MNPRFYFFISDETEAGSSFLSVSFDFFFEGEQSNHSHGDQVEFRTDRVKRRWRRRKREGCEV